MIDPTFRVTDKGISAPSYAEILEYYKEKARQIFGSDINLDADTQDGQLIAIFSKALHDVNSQAIAAYNQFNPQSAVGIGLDSAVKTNGIKRLDASHSKVDLKIIGQAGTEIRNGVVVDAFDNRWLLPNFVVIPLDGEIVVTANAEKKGSIKASPGTINVIATPTRGWQSVTNETQAVPGKAVETDAELRLRQEQSTSLPCVSLWEGIVSSVLAIEGVNRVSGIKNDSDNKSKEGIPPHSIAVIVDGGDAQAIGETIFKKKGPGTGTFGSVSVTYMDKYGFPNFVKFGRPKVVPIFVMLAIEPGLTYVSTVEDEIKTRIVAYIRSLAIGADVGIARVLASAIKDAKAVDTRFSVNEIQIGKDSMSVSAQSINIQWDEAATCSIENITIEVAHGYQKE